ncbi:hypothetical protein RBEAN4_0076 [Rickettsia bellii str. RML An4]|uniref:Uncharacterized protein n=1 Tax=Rickettsia bellii str. RML An4 TaxID=1359193 RepID=A0A0F3QCH3_RICBE|nr:hypothetical protein RBEAN4_0076 [Rickettsia bellii str. RML An4]
MLSSCLTRHPKNNKNTNFISIFNWIPQSSCRMTGENNPCGASLMRE